ncbi:MAG: substrate-binding domain-containing protein [Clostridiales bacterium]|nr:substrate-binding domain-containing protein [Clostridiales bacterium]MBR5058435.1 substrate-binding domain-containing protein [Clostridiales bacterium]
MKSSKGKRTIGLVLENMFTDFGEEFIQNVQSGVRQHKDLNLVVISGRYDGLKDKDPRHHSYFSIYNTVYQLEKQCKFDGLIICLGSMENVKVEEILKRYSSQLESKPIVFAASDIVNFSSVNYNNERGIKEAVDCLINVHGFTKFGMLGGRPDSRDSEKRKEIYSRLLHDNGISFTEENYEATDMSINCRDEAKALLDRNTDVQAIFCVNDSVAVSLYEEMEARRLVPGKDIMVFAFDNTTMAGRMIPALSSIGVADITLGRQSLNLLLEQMDGGPVRSVEIPTRLYGRDSFFYEMYEYTKLEMRNADPAFINRMFNDCFYRYRYEYISRESVNLQRLFAEFIGKILIGVKERYMSVEDFQEAQDLIDIFFKNGAIEYTDAAKLLQSIGRLQASVNIEQSNRAGGANQYINRLFTLMRDKAITAQAERIIEGNEQRSAFQQNFTDFAIAVTDFNNERSPLEDMRNRIVSNFDKLGLMNSALFFFDKRVDYEEGSDELFPEKIRLYCVLKEGELFVIPKERQVVSTEDMFQRVDLPPKCRECVPIPIFYKRSVYGFVVTELTHDIMNGGNFLADQIGRFLYTAELQTVT